MNYSFTVWGIAAPQGSKRHVGKGVMLESSDRVRPWRQDVRFAALEERPSNWDMATPMRLDLVFWFPRPASHYGTRNGISYLKANAPIEPVSARIGDIDKLQRAVFDALTGVAYLDDRQVVEVEARKAYLMGPDAAPYAHITIAPYV
ncbi:RusA-like Holliday junction resolvase [Synechococcus phage S-CBS3]|uniref:RusA-like Holliday junction resolvase n=1 Tax=Synechococcus phage S-CBS3 TaxID=753085 RepID=UPI0002078466|nr:RusA-like Holliday junction resolvase [Synechococcus phage S-CBS3]ADF42492.1 endodeoxyribonuclease [Synechococcus phage S-CBS3]